MNRYRRSPRRGAASTGPLVAFLLVASFGILFAGCTSDPVIRGPEDQPEDITFTEDDVARVQEGTEDMATLAGTASGTDALPLVDVAASGGALTNLDLSMVKTYQALRMMAGAGGSDVYRALNDVKVRPQAGVGGTVVANLVKGDVLRVIDFPNAGWAQVQLPDGAKGYVSARYIGKVTSADRLPEEKKAFEGQYYVDFQFLNVRATPDQKGEKVGELPRDAFVKPISMDDKWARISHQGKEAYVSSEYLSPFMPQFLVRQDTYRLPVLRYDASQPGMLEQLVQHAQRLRQKGHKFLTLRDFHDLLLAQEQRDARLDPQSVVIAVTGLTADNVRKVSDALAGNGIRATLFLQSGQLGLSGITEKNILTLLANGFDLQSAGHTGDDLRALTNAQVKLELEQSRLLLEEYTKKDVFAIAYAQGGVNDRVLQMAASAGYLFGIGSAPEASFSRDQMLRLPSFAVTSGMTAEDVLAAVK